MHTHCKTGGLKNAFTVWFNSLACRQIQTSEQTPCAFQVKEHVNRTQPVMWRSPSSTGTPSGRWHPHWTSLWDHHGDLHWDNSDLLCDPYWDFHLDPHSQLWTCGEQEIVSNTRLQSSQLSLVELLVVHQGLDFVHQFTCHPQDKLHIVTFCHLCRRRRM